MRTIIERDIVELAGIRKTAETRQVLGLFAARTGTELVMQNVIGESLLGRQAVYDRRRWLETIDLIRPIPAWSRSVAKRLVRAPKIVVTDPGLAAHLVGVDPAGLAEPTEPMAGRLVETFVITELVRQAGWADTDASIYHFRDGQGREIDVILETADRRVVAIEVKKAASVSAQDFRWLKWLRDGLGYRFVQGLVLYTGPEALEFGDRLAAVPVDALWRSHRP